jgi:acetoin utilization deacetylase AcuC-like enzyme
MGNPGETGRGAGEGTTLNCPLQPGAGDAEIIAAFNDRLVPAMKDFAPELVIISAGFDSHRADPLAVIGVTEDGFTAVTQIVMEIADATAGGRIVSFLEGGYDLRALASATAAHVAALMH